MQTRHRLLFAFVAFALVGAGCGDSDNDPNTAGSAATPITTAPSDAAVDPSTLAAPIALAPGTYQTSDTYTVAIELTFVTDGWHGAATGCKSELGSVRLATELGRMFLVVTPDLTSQEAGAELEDSPLQSVVIDDVEVAGRSGLLVAARLADTVDVTMLGSGPFGLAANTLLPYYQLSDFGVDDAPLGVGGPTRDLVYQPFIPGAQVDIYVLDTPAGVLSAVVTAPDDTMNEFRAQALAVLEVIEVRGTGEPGNCDSD